LQELEGFTFATALDITMAYYTITLDPDATKISIIIFPWGELFLPHVTDGYCRFSRHFQAKMSELMVALASMRTNLDDFLCITKTSLDDNLHHLRLVLTISWEAGLQLNAPKIESLHY
jgi:hypothetical protein